MVLLLLVLGTLLFLATLTLCLVCLLLLVPSPSFAGAQDPRWFEQTFKEFMDRPENKPAMIKHQRMEMRKAARINRKIKALEFKETVLGSDYETQKNIAVSERVCLLPRSRHDVPVAAIATVVVVVEDDHDEDDNGVSDDGYR